MFGSRTSDEQNGLARLSGRLRPFSARGPGASTAGAALFFAVLLALPLFSSGQPLNDENALELSLANAYVYIASRTTWPKEMESQSTFTFCVQPSHHLFEIFSKILPGKKLRGLAVTIRSFDADDVRTEQGCNLLALSSDDKVNRTIVEHVVGKPVLTISDEVDITRYEGIVYLAHDRRLEPPKVSFSSLASSGLKIDAAVLNLSEQRWGRGER